MSNIIDKNKRKKTNGIYNQCLMYALMTCAISAPWILPVQVQAHGNSKAVSTKKVKTSTKKSASNKLTQVIIIMDPAAAAVPTATAVDTQNQSPKAGQKISVTQTKIDNTFMVWVEGTKLKGYVPLANKSKSGVTIGTGLDLGQMHLAEFKSLPISSILKAKLAPYVGLKQNKALAFLKSHPLSISPKELEEIDVIAANKILQPLAAQFAKSSGKSFTSLPADAQTAIFSYAYQNGPGFMKKGKSSQLWHYFVAENWPKASQTLRGYKMYASRRLQEAHLLDKLA